MTKDILAYFWDKIKELVNTKANANHTHSYKELSDKPTLSSFGVTASKTELNYTAGVTSNIQTQLNSKLSKSGGTVNGTTTISGITTRTVTKDDNSGSPTYLLMFDITTWYNSTTTGQTKSGFNGFIYSVRNNGYMRDTIERLILGVSYNKVTAENGQSLILRTTSTEYIPCIIYDSVNSKYYLALRCSGSGRPLYFQGIFTGTYVGTCIKCIDKNGTLPEGYSVAIYDYKLLPGNSQADWNITDSSDGRFIKNKPTIPTKTSQLTNDSGFKTTDTNTTYTLSKSGTSIVLTGSDGTTSTVTDSNTTYSEATESKKGLMSATDKQRLDDLYELLSTRDLDGGTP